MRGVQRSSSGSSLDQPAVASLLSRRLTNAGACSVTEACTARTQSASVRPWVPPRVSRSEANQRERPGVGVSCPTPWIVWRRCSDAVVFTSKSNPGRPKSCSSPSGPVHDSMAVAQSYSWARQLRTASSPMRPIRFSCAEPMRSVQECAPRSYRFCEGLVQGSTMSHDPVSDRGQEIMKIPHQSYLSGPDSRHAHSALCDLVYADSGHRGSWRAVLAVQFNVKGYFLSTMTDDVGNLGVGGRVGERERGCLALSQEVFDLSPRNVLAVSHRRPLH